VTLILFLFIFLEYTSSSLTHSLSISFVVAARSESEICNHEYLNKFVANKDDENLQKPTLTATILRLSNFSHHLSHSLYVYLYFNKEVRERVTEREMVMVMMMISKKLQNTE
jgi:hypothetical protein